MTPKDNIIEEYLLEKMSGWIKDLPVLPPGWYYDIVPGEPHYNPETKTWDTTMEARPKHVNQINEQPQWKPTEEQMSMLLSVLREPNNSGAESVQLALKSLYNDLKAL